MSDTKQLLRETRDRIAPPPDVLGGLERRRRHQESVKRFAAAAVAIVVALVGLGGWFVLERDSTRRPADRSEELGIFAPVAGRIVYENEAEVGDLGYDLGLWAIDPSGPSDTVDGRTVADDVASTLVRLDLEATPLGWSSDGSELLFSRPDAASAGSLFPLEYLYILHADGSETRLNRDPISFGGATISPDGTRVVFAAWGDDLGLWVVDAEGGRPVRLPLPGAEGIVMSPTISPDGTRIAYLDSGNRENHVWVMDADGGNAREILANELIQVRGVGDLQWSPAGDRIAGVARSSEGTNAIYTFAPDGSDFTQVITYGFSPYWSPDGSQIAYTIECPELTSPSCLGAGSAGLAIADADGSNVREFGFAASGPWHPGVSATDDPAPTPDVGEDGVLRSDGEVLGFTGEPGGEPGDLVAVDPGSGEERVLVEDLETVYSARWSADGRWVAYEASGPGGIGLWVASASQEPRQVATGASMLGWSSTGAELTTIRPTSLLHTNIAGSTMSTIDPVTGETTEVGSIPERVGDVTSAPAWSPDGTRFVFGARGGAIYSIDVRSGARSLVVRLPGEDLDSVDQIVWSPDGAHIAVVNDGEPGGVYVMNADGSNVRVLLDQYSETGVAWSPDGTRLAYADDGVAWVAPVDGSAPSEIGPLSASCGALLCQEDLIWSPDGSQIAFRSAGQGSVDVSAIDADGQSDAERIDEMAYRSWDGGSYSCECA
jgi:Tol biopolymer transport system component